MMITDRWFNPTMEFRLTMFEANGAGRGYLASA